MNYIFAMHSEYLFLRVRPRLPSIFVRIMVSKQNFEQNKRFLQALGAGRISHFTSRIYPSLVKIKNKLKIGCFYKYRREAFSVFCGHFSLAGYEMIIAHSALTRLVGYLITIILISNAPPWNNC